MSSDCRIHTYDTVQLKRLLERTLEALGSVCVRWALEPLHDKMNVEAISAQDFTCQPFFGFVRQICLRHLRILRTYITQALEAPIESHLVLPFEAWDLVPSPSRPWMLKS